MNFDPSLMDLEGMHAWELYSANLRTELRQCRDEGRDVAQYEKLAEAISEMNATPLREELANLFYRAVTEAPIRADYPYVEPSDLEGIRAARPEERRQWKKPEKDELLAAKLRGAWLGRICGCLLGKPVEGWRTPELHKLLKGSGNFPLKRYMSRDDLRAADMAHKIGPRAAWIDGIRDGAPCDDDTNYTVMAWRIVANKGRGFTPSDVAEAWMAYQPKNAYCTAERRAFRNFVIGIRPPQSATYKNPDREFIGAQIRGDYFGYINPGDPAAAAEMAWRAACISHVKNGIYGEMFIAAMIAAAAVCDDVKTVILAGLEQIPEKSRLAERVKAVIGWYDEGVLQQDCFARIHEEWDEFDGYDWVHTISNAMIVAAALLYGGKDYTRSICMAVQTGFDTDCNGATVGSILGMMLTDAGIDEAWKAPVGGRLHTNIFGMSCVEIEDMVEKTMAHIE
jgi:ADP-ribosylglycohydrolase